MELGSPSLSTDKSNETMSSAVASSESSDGLTTEPRAIIGVMGQTGVGKTTFINTASRSNLSVGKGIDSCTSEVQGSESFELDGRSVTLIDTPGFDDSVLTDVAVLEMIAAFLGISYKGNVKLAGVIYMHRISDIRVTGTSKRNFRMFRRLCGENALKNVVIVTTMWGNLPVKKEGEDRETELRKKDGFFKAALDQGAKMVRHEHPTDLNSAHEILRLIIGNNPSPLLIQRELVDQEKPLAETSAGEEANRELATIMQNQENEITKLQQEFRVRNNDGETKRELEEEIEAHKEKIRKVEAEMKKLEASKFSWVLSGVAAGGVAVAAVVGGGTLGGVVALSTAVTGIAALVKKSRGQPYVVNASSNIT